MWHVFYLCISLLYVTSSTNSNIQRKNKYRKKNLNNSILDGIDNVDDV